MSEGKFKELDLDKRIWWGDTGSNMPAQKRFLTEVRQGIVPQTMWFYGDVGHTQEAKRELLEFVHYKDTDNVLDTVKPTRLLRRVLQLGTEAQSDDLVLDFFSGSSSFAHSVLLQNRADEGNRRFIAVQIPEPLPTPEKSLKTMADVGKERIRRVIHKLKTEPNIEFEGKEDLGFKVFKLAESNYAGWRGVEERTPAAYHDELDMFTDALRKGWTPENVLWEVAIKEGYSLNCRIETLTIPGNTVYRVTDPEKDPEQHFLACLDDELKEDIAKTLNLSVDDLFVCRDRAIDDTLAANLALQCRLKTI